MTQKMNSSVRRFANAIRIGVSLIALLLLAWAPAALRAQTAGEGTITGVVKDSTGAAIANATISATNIATNVSTERTTSSAGDYTIAPLPPGTYSIQVSAQGFKSLRQDNLTVDALGSLGFNPVLTLGEATETVVVTTAPPILDTTTATLGMVMENSTYSNLPIQMNGAQRDATAFGTLAPGAQGGSRLPIIGGTGNYLGQLYLDGMPAETISQQGDNRLVSEAVDLDAVDQFQVVTSTPPAEYSGAGSMNFTMKSGALKPHGQVSDFVRNTIFDAWSFTAKAATVKNAQGLTVPAPKPIEHQNELSASFGWKVPLTKNKLFFFVAYDKYHYRKGATYALYTVPTTLMRTGDFTELNGGVGTGGLTGIAGDPSDGGLNKAIIYDPTVNSCPSSTCTRNPFMGIKNGLPTYNVIPASYISPISQAMQSFLPPPSNPATVTNNYLGGFPSGFDNHVVNYRVDFDLSSKQRLSTVGALGTVDYLNNFAAPFIASPSGGATPYIGGDLASIFPKVFDIEDTYTINARMTNQLKYGYTRFYQDIADSTQGVAPWEAGAFGITNLPAGQAGLEFPGAAFSTTTAFGTVQSGWTSNSNADATQLTTPNNFTIVDNFQWLKGKHSFTFGITYQWQEINNANPATYTGVLDLTYNANSTAQFVGSSLSTTTTGYSYASYLLGAVGGTPAIGLQPVSEEGGRYRPVSPYVEDSYKLSSKITLDLGLRWDYFPPYREVKDHWTFLNPTLMNSATGTPGVLQFAGNYGGAGVSCGCTTPVHTYWKNWGPRVGLAYSVDDKTVLRIGFGEVFSEAGGVGGRGGAFNGTGQTGFNVTATAAPEVTTGSGAGPSFYLNNGPYFTGMAMANTSLFGSGFVYPSAPTPGPAAQLLNTGNYLISPTKVATASGVSFADPYISGRAPEFNFYNVGLERGITRDMTIAVNYVGDQSHFLINSTSSGANARGYWANQLDPKYLLGLGPVTGINATGATVPILNAPATSANVAKAQSVMAGISVPAFFMTAANALPATATLTLAQALVAFPQYSGVSDTWGENVGNFSYNSLQITLLQRMAHGLSFNINYTYSKNIGDDGTFRSGFNIPAGAVSGNSQNWKQDRIDRSWTTVSGPQSLHAFGVYQLPFGKGHIGANSMLVRALAGGWQLSGIYTYASGTPMAVTSSVCSGTTYPGQGQCMPDLNIASPDYLSKNARINGSPGSGPNGRIASNLGSIRYVDPSAFTIPANISTAPNASSLAQYLIGNSPRTRPLNLMNPGTQDLDSSVRRSFALPEGMSLVFEADCLNTWNKVTFSGPGGSWGSTTNLTGPLTYSAAFGEITGVSNSPRDWQFAGHFNF